MEPKIDKVNKIISNKIIKDKIIKERKLPQLNAWCITPSILPIKENVYSKVKISDVFALEKLILPRFKV